MAEVLDAEILSVDSRQVYRHLDVGADKIDGATRERIPHHLLDVVDPDQPFSAADFGVLASRAIREVTKRRKVPLLVGGTSLLFPGSYGTPSLGGSSQILGVAGAAGGAGEKSRTGSLV